VILKSTQQKREVTANKKRKLPMDMLRKGQPGKLETRPIRVRMGQSSYRMVMNKTPTCMNAGHHRRMMGKWVSWVKMSERIGEKALLNACRTLALKYVLVDGELHRRMVDGILLKCLDKEQAHVAMCEVHEGLCGTHQSTHKMKWTFRRVGYFWLTMVDDCNRYQKGCEACQRFGDVQTVPASIMHPICEAMAF
jgi:hypothetical protein